MQSIQSTPVDYFECAVGGQTLQLHADRGLLWTERATLFIADLHLGKTGTFRHFGIPVPDTTAADLARLQRLIARTSPRRLVILGDLIHHRTGMDDRLIEQVAGWRDQLAGIEMLLVRGNHDRHVPQLPKQWQIDEVSPPHSECPFVFAHVPPVRDEAWLDTQPDREHRPCVLAGHLHPAFALADKGRHRLKLPGFWLRPDAIVLPAFSQFIDGAIVRPEPHDRVVLIADQQVIEVPAVLVGSQV